MCGSRPPAALWSETTPPPSAAQGPQWHPGQTPPPSWANLCPNSTDWCVCSSRLPEELRSETTSLPSYLCRGTSWLEHVLATQEDTPRLKEVVMLAITAPSQLPMHMAWTTKLMLNLSFQNLIFREPHFSAQCQALHK